MDDNCGSGMEIWQIFEKIKKYINPIDILGI